MLAASDAKTNSAPVLEFSEEPRYLSFNSDSSIHITTGTYSPWIDITSSDSEEFLTNVRIDLASTGFVFEPSSVLLKVGDQKGQFRVGADSSLLPLFYTYSATKT